MGINLPVQFNQYGIPVYVYLAGVHCGHSARKEGKTDSENYCKTNSEHNSELLHLLHLPSIGFATHDIVPVTFVTVLLMPNNNASGGVGLG